MEPPILTISQLWQPLFKMCCSHCLSVTSSLISSEIQSSRGLLTMLKESADLPDVNAATKVYQS